ncbi:MAG: PhzF family phenazine biosynthesis protein [Vicinamibacterales bacterium]
MPSARYLHYDVFTDRAFEGNQLAVFPDAAALDAALMQRLTNEMNFAESTFVLPAERADTDVRMRIFTPAREMPMAGHPTIGTTFALAALGVIPAGRARWVFGLNVGPTPVALEWDGDRLAHAWMDQGRPEFRPAAEPAEAILDAIHADRLAWQATGLPVEEASCGAPFIYVPLATRAAVDACEPDGAAVRRLRGAFEGRPVGLFVFSPDAGADGATVYSRMFAPEAGVVEDPATGGASGPLAGYLVRHGVVTAAAAAAGLTSVQGVTMGRPSRLHMRVEADSPSDIRRVHVGGAAVAVGDGLLRW